MKIPFVKPKAGLIPPRTKDERRAYVSGYANAIIDIDKSGIDTARKWLREMLDLDRDDNASK